MKAILKKYPFDADCAFIVGLDDLHPEGVDDTEGLDFGKNFRGDFWKRIDALTKAIPEVKITLFTPADWTDRSNFPSGVFWPLRKIYSRRRSYQRGFNLSDERNKGWVKELNTRVIKGNITLAYHGLTHHNDNKKFAASQEFEGLTKNQTETKVDDMLFIADASGLKYVKGFRSPGWGTTVFLNKTLKDRDFLYTANSTDFVSEDLEGKSKGTGLTHQKIIDMTLDNGIPNFTANCYPDQIERAIEIAKKKGIIVVHAHVAPTIFGLKYVDLDFVFHIQKMIQEIRYQTLAHIWFATFDEVAKFVKVRDQIKISHKGNIVSLQNPTKDDIYGFTLTIDNKPFVISLIKAGKTVSIDPIKKDKGEKVSIILTVYNGAHQVIPSLQSLCNQSYPNIEIIVVNDGSTDNTKKVLEDYIKTVKDSRIQVINQKNGGRSNARNNGFEKSSGSIITFCEDDALYDRDYVVNAIKHFDKKDKKLAGVIGPHYVWNKKESINTRVKDVERRRNFYHYKPQSTWFYKRDLFEKIGRFDETLELVEDVAPAILLRQQGYHFDFEPEARWLHKEPANLKNYLRRKFRGGVGMALLQKKNLRRRIVPIPYLFINVLLFIVGLLVLIYTPQFFFVTLLIGIIFLFVIRYQAFTISRKVSDESSPFLIFAIMYEYIWWMATLTGYFYGLRMSVAEINKYLKGR
ncbi:MAG TPA: bifunctional polysaccharide deacetylase/glycosyltransferase family 2 protein [Patescibacteria group bacterium]|nr:bifunctional polysaccharide deacetylase/glycosyltransferase family 2 protein [Patescibacteria group bacterium]